MRMRLTAKRLSLLLSLLVALTVIVPSTLAYVVERTGTLHNRFEPVGGTAPIHAQVEVEITKKIRSMGDELIGPKGFRFRLVDTDSGEEFVFTSDQFGKAKGLLSFNALEDADQTYSFRLFEINDQAEDIVYDKNVFNVSIFVKQDPITRQLLPQVTVDGKPAKRIEASFTNVYAPSALPPLTGDDFHFVLCILLMAASAAFAVQLVRKPKQM